MSNDIFSLIPFALVISLSGFVSGFIAGLLGVGGGIIIVPVLYHFLSLVGVPQEVVMHISVATSLAVIIPTGWRSYKSHQENDNIDYTVLKSWLLPTIFGSIFKVVLTPICGLLFMNFFELTEMLKMITIIFLGVPTAGTSYVLAEELGCDGPLSARIVALSTLLSALTLPWLISLNL